MLSLDVSLSGTAIPLLGDGWSIFGVGVGVGIPEESLNTSRGLARSVSLISILYGYR